MNNKYRLFRKIPIVDILIVLLICGVGAFAVWFLTRPSVSEENLSTTVVQTQTVEYDLLVTSVSDSITALPAQGQTVFDSETMTAIGTVTRVSVSPAYTYVVNKQSGKSEKVAEKDRHAVEIIVRVTTPTVSDRGVYIGDTHIAISKMINYATESFGAQATVMGVRVEEVTKK